MRRVGELSIIDKDTCGLYVRTPKVDPCNLFSKMELPFPGGGLCGVQVTPKRRFTRLLIDAYSVSERRVCGVLRILWWTVVPPGAAAFPAAAPGSCLR